MCVQTGKGRPGLGGLVWFWPTSLNFDIVFSVVFGSARGGEGRFRGSGLLFGWLQAELTDSVGGLRCAKPLQPLCILFKKTPFAVGGISSNQPGRCRFGRVHALQMGKAKLGGQVPWWRGSLNGGEGHSSLAAAGWVGRWEFLVQVFFFALGPFWWKAGPIAKRFARLRSSATREARCPPVGRGLRGGPPAPGRSAALAGDAVRGHRVGPWAERGIGRLMG